MERKRSSEITHLMLVAEYEQAAAAATVIQGIVGQHTQQRTARIEHELSKTRC